jgi:hypothetical protein
MIRSFSLVALLFCWAASFALPARAATYLLNNGQSLTGDPISATKDGLVVRISEGVFSKREGWTNFTQEALEELIKDPKIKPFAEPFIEKDVDETEVQKKKIEIRIVEPDRLDRPDPKAGVGSIFASPITILLFILIYAANIYAGFEVALFRNYHPALVCGIAAVVPIIGPVLFLCLPTHIKTYEEQAGVLEEEAVPYDEAVSPEVAAQLAAEAPPPPPPEAFSKYPPTKTFRRGEFTFNRRFFETQLASFLRVVPTEADKDMFVEVKSLRGDFVGTRLAKVLQNEIGLLVDKGGVTQEVMIPFTEIQLVQLRHKDAPPHA